MENENAFWISVWKIVAVGVVSFFTVLVTSCQVTNYRIVQAIEAGADPIEARCAISESTSTDCVFVYAKTE